MTTPRSTQIDLSATPYYHCISRCVRRAYLCGYDKESKRCLDHRKQWLIDRIKHLASIFYIQIAAYAIMDNHYHLVLHVDSARANQASNDEILHKWEMLYPNNFNNFKSLRASTEAVNTRIQLWRKRFMDVSWFMKLLNEYMARMANQEDECNGRFWQGRFKSQALLDELAVLVGMVYVDLNPIRAGMATTPEGSEFTSIQERIAEISKQLRQKPHATNAINQSLASIQPTDLMPFGGNENSSKCHINFELSEYIQLVESTGRMLSDNKRNHIPENLRPIFKRLDVQVSGWMSLVNNLEYDYYFAVGSPDLLASYGRICRSTRKKGIKGITLSKKCYPRAPKLQKILESAHLN